MMKDVCRTEVLTLSKEDLKILLKTKKEANVVGVEVLTDQGDFCGIKVTIEEELESSQETEEEFRQRVEDLK